jgi:hypothetical protein
MPHKQALISKIFTIESEDSFLEISLEVFRFQYHNNPVYQAFCDYLHVNPNQVEHYTQIPFLPVEFFRNKKIVSGNKAVQTVFSSSGTTGNASSFHHVCDTALYEESFLNAFNRFYGPPSDFCILALLPSYLERNNSSLVYMADKLIALSGHEKSGFYLYDLHALNENLLQLREKGQKTILLGVTYAMLDLVAAYPISFPDLIVMETGGMKGRRREMIREELHDILCEGFGVAMIHSEYGMTELLSQAYSHGNGVFETPPWMRVLIRDSNDPLSLISSGKTGGINIIDLANLYSCAFIGVQDLGRLLPGGGFEVLGRFDRSQMRGCNLLVG